MVRMLPLAAVLVLAAAIPASQQTVVFSGRVTDSAAGSVLASASVSIEGAYISTLTDNAGKYRLEWRRGGRADTTVMLSVKRVGYAPVFRSVAVRGTAVTADFKLPQQALILSGVQGGTATPPARVGAISTGSVGNSTSASGSGRGGAAGGRGGGAASAGNAQGQQGQGQAASRDRVQFSARSASASESLARRCFAQPCDPNTESYDRIVDNPFLAVADEALSTFSIDVDRASFGNIRRYINTMRQKPPKDAVRIEELINYFPYDYPAPADDHPFSVTTEVARAPWNAEHRLLRIGLQAEHIDTRNLPPSNLVFLLDVSGSMMAANKLPLVKSSMRLLVDQLREQDMVSIVVYASSTGLVLPPTSGHDKRTIIEAIERLEAGGSTAGGAGLKLAYAVARQNFMPNGNNRIIIATDGDFNVGASSDAEMERLVEAERKHGSFLTVLGFGYGNLKDSKLESIADKGNGNYAYIDDINEARKVLVQEFGGTLMTVAKDVKLQIEFNPSRVQAYRLIGYENRLLAAADFNNDQKDAGEMGAGHSITALYEIIPVGSRSTTAIQRPDSLRYQTVTPRAASQGNSELLFVKLRYKDPKGETSRLLTHAVPDRVTRPSVDFNFTAAVAAFGMILRESEYKGSASVASVIALASPSLGSDAHGYRADFLAMVRNYEKLARVDR